MNTKIKPDTIARTIVLALALINQCLAIAGKGTIQIAENDIYQTVSLVWTIVSAVVAWWYNNSFTHHARRADEYFRALKNGGID
jgi:SPP1 family holin